MGEVQPSGMNYQLVMGMLMFYNFATYLYHNFEKLRDDRVWLFMSFNEEFIWLFLRYLNKIAKDKQHFDF